MAAWRPKVSAFNAVSAHTQIRCAVSRDGVSVSLPPFDPQTEALRVSVRYSRELLALRIEHSDSPRSLVFALRPDLVGRHGDVEICILIGRKRLIPYMHATVDRAAEIIIECLLRL